MSHSARDFGRPVQAESGAPDIHSNPDIASDREGASVVSDDSFKAVQRRVSDVSPYPTSKIIWGQRSSGGSHQRSINVRGRRSVAVVKERMELTRVQ
jgi:hypothetical protein